MVICSRKTEIEQFKHQERLFYEAPSVQIYIFSSYPVNEHLEWEVVVHVVELIVHDNSRLVG